jgi:PRTRC genetic system protein C
MARKEDIDGVTPATRKKSDAPAPKPAPAPFQTPAPIAPESIVPNGRIRRIFMHGAQRLQDPNPAASALEAKKILAASYPELASATLTLTETKEVNGTKVEHWEFKRSVGTKG